ncbi:MAG: TraX family protein [Christensenellales bacterium]
MRRSRRAGAFPVRKRFAASGGWRFRCIAFCSRRLRARADIRAYARRLLLLACVSEIPFDLLIFGRLSSAMEQNVVFSLLLAACAVRGAGAFRPSAALRAPFWR